MSGSGLRKRLGNLAGLVTLLNAAGASSLAEFAICLPLLIVLVVGIFDFGGAFNQKQQLSNAMREGARFGASEATNDLASGSAPPSVDAIRYLVDSYLVAARMNDCGLGTVTPPSGGPPWVYQTTGTCVGQLMLTIARDPPSGASATLPTCALTATNYGGSNPITINIPCTQVTISYPYQWHFNSVIQLLVPGASLGLTQIAAKATAANMN
ncbi:MAG TPA: TadE/TadG family type IV pilus assembly protein [Terriglobales bacterium]|nr:TadE/TadG family type IV pilus assembly protein [Terriglobales bacterium]